MPMSTELIREAKPVKMYWSVWHLMRLWDAIIAENPDEYENGELKDKSKADKIGPYPYGYVFKEPHAYETTEEQIFTDGDVGVPVELLILPGDTYNCWR